MRQWSREMAILSRLAKRGHDGAGGGSNEDGV
jgi:hypothetical protein